MLQGESRQRTDDRALAVHPHCTKCAEGWGGVEWQGSGGPSGRDESHTAALWPTDGQEWRGWALGEAQTPPPLWVHSSSVWFLCHLHWQLPSLTTEWSVSSKSDMHCLSLRLPLSVFHLCRKWNIWREVWVSAINFSSENAWGKTSLLIVSDRYWRMGWDRPGSKRIWWLWNRTGKQSWGGGGDGVFAQESLWGCIPLPVGWGGAASLCPRYRSAGRIQVGESEMLPVFLPAIRWSLSHRHWETGTGVNCGRGLIKTEGKHARNIQGFWDATRLHGMSLSPSSHMALQASYNESQQLHCE